MLSYMSCRLTIGPSELAAAYQLFPPVHPGLNSNPPRTTLGQGKDASKTQSGRTRCGQGIAMVERLTVGMLQTKTLCMTGANDRSRKIAFVLEAPPGERHSPVRTTLRVMINRFRNWNDTKRQSRDSGSIIRHPFKSPCLSSGGRTTTACLVRQQTLQNADARSTV